MDKLDELKDYLYTNRDEKSANVIEDPEFEIYNHFDDAFEQGREIGRAEVIEELIEIL